MPITKPFGLCAALLASGLTLLLVSTFGQSPAVMPLPAQGGTRGPSALLFRPDGKQLFVAEQDENDVAVVDGADGKIISHLPTGGDQPCAFALAPEGHALVVANTFSGSVGIIDIEKRTVRAQIPLLGEPAGVAVTSDGRAWISVSQLDQVAVLDIAQGKVLQRIPVGHHPGVLALAPDGKTLVCANSLGGSLSLIDTASCAERRRIPLPAINLRGMAFTADGSHLWITGQQPHNELSTTRPETLWSNVLCEVAFGEEKEKRRKGEKETGGDNSSLIPHPSSLNLERMLVLDLPEYGASDPCGIALDSKGETAYVALSGTHEVAAVPLQGVSGQGEEEEKRRKGEKETGEAKAPKSVFKSDGGEIEPSFPIVHVGSSVRRVRVGCNPRALALNPQRQEVWVGNHLGNSLTVLPAVGFGAAGEKTPANSLTMRLVDLGAATPNPNRRLKGRFFFASAHVSHGQFFSCESCHPNGGTDGLSWKFAHVKDGMDARNTKDLRGLLLLTAPYGWGGREEDFEVFVHDEVGGLLKTRHLQHPEVHALWDLVNETTLPPNPYRNSKGAMTAAALRGKALFTGQAGCARCHVGNMFGGTKKRENIGTTPKDITIDVPHLVGAYDSAPYLHDGRAQTLEEIFTKYNPEHRHGNAAMLTPEQLRDLLEYVREL